MKAGDAAPAVSCVRPDTLLTATLVENAVVIWAYPSVMAPVEMSDESIIQKTRAMFFQI